MSESVRLQIMMALRSFKFSMEEGETLESPVTLFWLLYPNDDIYPKGGDSYDEHPIGDWELEYQLQCSTRDSTEFNLVIQSTLEQEQLMVLTVSQTLDSLELQVETLEFRGYTRLCTRLTELGWTHLATLSRSSWVILFLLPSLSLSSKYPNVIMPVLSLTHALIQPLTYFFLWSVCCSIQTEHTNDIGIFEIQPS
jgi:hypothetical protein